LLKIGGNAENQFANANSININPVVHVEWNYNLIEKPYVVNTSSSAPLSQANILRDKTGWSVTDGLSHSIFNDDDNLGISCDTNPDDKTVVFNGVYNYAEYESDTINVTAAKNSYYKAIFYVKSDEDDTYSELNSVPRELIDLTPQRRHTSGKAIKYYYRLIPVGQTGAVVPPDPYLADVQSVEVQATGNSYIDVGLDYISNSKYAAKAYHIYRGQSVGGLAYVDTVKFDSKIIKPDISSVSKGNGRTNGTFYFSSISDYSVGEKLSITIKGRRATWTITELNGAGTAITASTTTLYQNAKIPRNTRASKISYRDKLSTPLSRLAPVMKTTNSTLIPEVTLKMNESYLETTRSFLKVYETPNSEPTYNKGSVGLDSIGFKKIEILFGCKDAFNKIKFNFNVVSKSAGSRMVLYRPQIFKITSWEFYTSPYYPVDSCFEGFRPGEALLNPYLQSDDRFINKSKLGLSGTRFTKPSCFMVFSPEGLFSSLRPYKQMYNSLTDTNLKYFVSDELDVLSDPKDGNSGLKISVRAQYNNYMSINKIVIKGSNCLSDIRLSTGNIKLLLGDGSTETIPYGKNAFNNSGILTLYYDGKFWSTARPSINYPPALSDSGVLINVLPEVTGIIFNMDTLSWSDKTSINFKDYKRRAHIFEISPRLEVDVSGLTKSINVNKELDNGNTAGFPLGMSNANSADITLSNIPVLMNSFPHTIFDHYSDSSTFAGMLKKNCKFTVGLESRLSSFYDYIPLFTMYSEQWNVSGFEVSVNLFDASKTILMSKQAPDYFGQSESMFETITTILDVSGFSDYDYDGLRVLLKNRRTKTTHYWSDKSKQSLFEAMQGYLAAHQISAHIDEYGILRFIDLEKIVTKYYDNKLSPDFAVTDKELTILNSEGEEVRYIPNIMNDSYSENIAPQVGKVSLSYQIPTVNYSGDTSKDFDTGRQSAAEKSVWSSQTNTGLVRTLADRSVKYNDEYVYISPTKLTDPNKTLTGLTGTFFLQGELVTYEGLSYKFTPIQEQNSLTVRSTLPYLKNSAAFSAIVSSGSDFAEITQDLMNQDPSITSVKYNFTGNIHGLARGQRFTSVRSHRMFDEGKTLVRGYERPDRNFKKEWIDKVGNFNNPLVQKSRKFYAKDYIKFNKNVATFTIKNQVRPLVLYPIANTSERTVPTSASVFNTFSTVFKAPDPKHNKQVALGIFVNTNQGVLLFRLLNSGKKTKLLKKLNQQNTIQLKQVDSKGNVVPNQDTGYYTKNVFDGKSHRMTVIFHYSVNRRFVNTSNALKYCTVYVDDARYGTFVVSGANDIKLAGRWGCWAGNNSNFLNLPKDATLARRFEQALADQSVATVSFYELYAVDWFNGCGTNIDNKTIRHHWQASAFLERIMDKNPEAEPKYYFWGPMYLTGAQFIENERFSINPIFTKTARTTYSGYNPHTRPGPKHKFRVVRPNNVGFSIINTSPFRFSQAAVNRDTGTVLLSTADRKVGNGDINNYGVNAFFNKLSDAKLLERVVDPANISQSISIETPWVQTERDAEMLLDRIALFATAFNSEVSVSIFGNPLIQLGDFCQLVYSVKKIGYDPNSSTGGVEDNVKTFLVKGISHDFSNGLKTQLTLKPMFQLPQ
jgi:hypothetical protein